MDDEHKIETAIARSPLYVQLYASFIGIAITIFVLVLTIRSELFSSKILTYQLVLTIPFWIITLLTQVKIVHARGLKTYYLINKLVYGIAFAFLYNSLGLLITGYISLGLGLVWFSIYLIYSILSLVIDFRKNRLYGDLTSIIIIILLGILPALGIINF